ncbi:MAG: transglutaminase family protein [Chloroflexota bacterium]
MKKNNIDPKWLEPTWFIDSNSNEVRQFAETAVADAIDPVEKARRLFYAVRDGYRYDPYVIEYEPEAFKASTIAKSERNWCTPKSILMVAAARSLGIPARLGFADVRNHLTTEKLSATMGTDLFVWHGYAELLINGRWVKLSTAFNIELCEKFGVKVLEFDAEKGALMHPFDQAGKRHMEYVVDRGSYDDLPLEEMFDSFADYYPKWRSVLRGGGDAPEAEPDAAFE